MSGTTGNINFTYFSPAAWRNPGIFVETNSAVQNISTGGKTLLIGMKLPVGTCAVNVPFLAVSAANVALLAGTGSMLHLMYLAYAANDPTATIWCLPCSAATGATAGVQTITPAFVGTNTAVAANGTIPLYVAGYSVPVAVTAAQVLTGTGGVGAAISKAINSNVLIPATATVNATTGVVTVTAEHSGLAASDVDLRVAYYGPAAGEIMPASIALTFGTTTAGQTDPDLATGLVNINGQSFDYIVNPFVGGPTAPGAQVGEITTYLSEATGCWSPYQKLYGQAFSAIRGTVSQLVTYASGMNDPFTNLLGYNNSPTPAYLMSAALGGACANSLRANPALPLHDVAVNGVLPPVAGFDFQPTDRNTLLFSGISTFTTKGGQIVLSRMRTTYQTNALGISDVAYLDTETPATLTAIERAFISGLASQFARKILVADGTPLSQASNYTTSQAVRAAAISIYQTLCNQGIAQNFAYFAANAQAQNQGGGVVALYLPVDCANQLRQIAINVAFSKT